MLLILSFVADGVIFRPRDQLGIVFRFCEGVLEIIVNLFYVKTLSFGRGIFRFV